MSEPLKYNLLLYCYDRNGCRCFSKLVKEQFDINFTQIKNNLDQNMLEADAAVICFAKAGKNNNTELLITGTLSSRMPVLSCTEKLNADFISGAVEKGIKRFISADMESEKISALIINAIKQNDLRKFIEKKFSGYLGRSIYAKKIIDFIIKSFPQRINAKELSEELNVSVRWLQKECKKAFAITYKQLLRIIWVYQAVRLIENTDFDNTCIAMQLNYRELSSMNRDFRKVLNLTPNEVRKKLASVSIDQLFEI